MLYQPPQCMKRFTLSTHSALISRCVPVIGCGEVVEGNHSALHQKLLQLRLCAVDSVVCDFLSPPAVRIPPMSYPHVSWAKQTSFECLHNVHV